MELNTLPTTDPLSLYSLVKMCVIVAGMWLVAACTSACGLKMGDNTLIGTPSFAQTVYAGELELRRAKK